MNSLGDGFDVAVAGAGIAGLTCAAALAQAGMRVAVLEAAAHAGGRASSSVEDGIARARAGVIVVAPQAMARVEPRGEGGERLASVMQTAQAFRPVRYLSTFLGFDRKLTRERFWSRDGRRRPEHRLLRPVQHPRRWCGRNIVVIARWRSARRPRGPTGRPSLDPGVPGLWLAGDWTATSLPCSMESAARSGALAAEAVAAARGVRLRMAEPLPETQGVVALLRRAGLSAVDPRGNGARTTSPGTRRTRRP